MWKKQVDLFKTIKKWHSIFHLAVISIFIDLPITGETSETRDAQPS